jgi:sphingomyelin phosphodiesterase 2
MVVSSALTAESAEACLTDTMNAATQQPASHTSANGILDLPSNLRVLSLNCWGLKYISQYRNARLVEIGKQIAALDPPPNIVGLQECWTQEDYLAIREIVKAILPHGKFYHSGIFGGGLAILSRWEIEESSMVRYPLNGRPAAFYRGDWYVGKGVACARIRFGAGRKDVAEVFCTHLHAPYEKEPHDSYLCHRTAQAWEIAKLMRQASERGHVVLGLGDFNMLPLSLAHRLIEAHGDVKDVWRITKPGSGLGAWEDGHLGGHEGEACPDVEHCLDQHGATCDSQLNTWRWSKSMRKDLQKGKDTVIEPQTKDPRAKRLDYIFFSPGQGGTGGWSVADVRVGMTSRHPELRCSLSDHFSVEATIERMPNVEPKEYTAPETLPIATYDQILAMTQAYTARERTQRVLRLGHFLYQLGLSIGCLVGVWWSPHNYVAFILMLLSSVGLSVGVIEGLMGGLFVGSEERALREFEWEIENAKRIAGKAIKDGEKIGRGPVHVGAIG